MTIGHALTPPCMHSCPRQDGSERCPFGLRNGGVVDGCGICFTGNLRFTAGMAQTTPPCTSRAEAPRNGADGANAALKAAEQVYDGCTPAVPPCARLFRLAGVCACVPVMDGPRVWAFECRCVGNPCESASHHSRGSSCLGWTAFSRSVWVCRQLPTVT